MALSDLSFKLYLDSGLTVAFSNLLQLVNQSDLSDNPQDFVYYFGSTNALNKLQATSSPGVDPIILTPVDTLPIWILSTAYTVGTLRQPTTPNGFKYRVSAAGTSSGTEPTWPISGIGSTVTDGTVIWKLEGAHHNITEITLALSSGDLATNIPGDTLNIGATIPGGVANAVPIYVRVVNAVTTVGNNAGYPEMGVSINEVEELAI